MKERLGGRRENLPFGEGKQSAWPPLAVLAQKKSGRLPGPTSSEEARFIPLPAKGAGSSISASSLFLSPQSHTTLWGPHSIEGGNAYV